MKPFIRAIERMFGVARRKIYLMHLSSFECADDRWRRLISCFGAVLVQLRL